jgi:hypothetical protein
METNLPYHICQGRTVSLLAGIYIYTSYISHVVPIYFPWLFRSKISTILPAGPISALLCARTRWTDVAWCKELPKYRTMGDLTDQKLGFHGFFDAF